MRPGDALPEQAVVADAQSMRVLTLIMHDPNPIHYDASAVQAVGLGERPINQGTLNMAYALNAVAAAAGGVQRVRKFRCRFLGSVFEGDEVVAGGRVTEVLDGGGTGTAAAQCAVWVDGPGAKRVVEGTAIVEIG